MQSTCFYLLHSISTCITSASTSTTVKTESSTKKEDKSSNEATIADDDVPLAAPGHSSANSLANYKIPKIAKTVKLQPQIPPPIVNRSVSQSRLSQKPDLRTKLQSGD